MERILNTSQTFSHFQERTNFKGSMQQPAISPAIRTRETPGNTERPISDSRRKTISSHMMRRAAGESCSNHLQPSPERQSGREGERYARGTRVPVPVQCDGTGQDADAIAQYHRHCD